MELDNATEELFFDSVEHAFQCMQGWKSFQDKPAPGKYIVLPVMVFIEE